MSAQDAGATGPGDLEEKEWEWATPISTDFLVRQPAQLYCQRCDQALYVTGGVIELWEMALDAKRHALEEH